MQDKIRESAAFKIAEVAIMAALCYVGFIYCQIPIPLPNGSTVAFHIGNAFCVLAALLLGGWKGGLAGAVGMTLADLLDPRYITAAPKTFLLKFGIGLICGLIAHGVFKIAALDENGKPRSQKMVTLGTILGASAGMLFNIIAEPIVSYFYTRFLLGQAEKAAHTLANWQAITTSVNAVLAIIIASVLYLALRPLLIKQRMFHFSKPKAAKAVESDK